MDERTIASAVRLIHARPPKGHPRSGTARGLAPGVGRPRPARRDRGKGPRLSGARRLSHRDRQPPPRTLRRRPRHVPLPRRSHGHHQAVHPRRGLLHRPLSAARLPPGVRQGPPLRPVQSLPPRPPRPGARATHRRVGQPATSPGTDRPGPRPRSGDLPAAALPGLRDRRAAPCRDPSARRSLTMITPPRLGRIPSRPRPHPAGTPGGVRLAAENPSFIPPRRDPPGRAPPSPSPVRVPFHRSTPLPPDPRTRLNLQARAAAEGGSSSTPPFAAAPRGKKP